MVRGPARRHVRPRQPGRRERAGRRLPVVPGGRDQRRGALVPGGGGTGCRPAPAELSRRCGGRHAAASGAVPPGPPRGRARARRHAGHRLPPVHHGARDRAGRGRRVRRARAAVRRRSCPPARKRAGPGPARGQRAVRHRGADSRADPVGIDRTVLRGAPGTGPGGGWFAAGGPLGLRLRARGPGPQHGRPGLRPRHDGMSGPRLLTGRCGCGTGRQR